jgi:hypothetical protein
LRAVRRLRVPRRRTSARRVGPAPRPLSPVCGWPHGATRCRSERLAMPCHASFWRVVLARRSGRTAGGGYRISPRVRAANLVAHCRIGRAGTSKHSIADGVVTSLTEPSSWRYGTTRGARHLSDLMQARTSSSASASVSKHRVRSCGGGPVLPSPARIRGLGLAHVSHSLRRAPFWTRDGAVIRVLRCSGRIAMAEGVGPHEAGVHGVHRLGISTTRLAIAVSESSTMRTSWGVWDRCCFARRQCGMQTMR